MGAKYVSRLSEDSVGVGEGEVTLGVAGTWYFCDIPPTIDFDREIRVRRPVSIY